MICDELNLDTSYGGCGPIALIRILDYFAYVLDYDEITKDLTSLEEQLNIIRDVLSETKTYEIGFGEKQTLAFPSDKETSFNNLMEKYNLEDRIKANYDLSIIGNDKTFYFNKNTESIKKGYPVTLGIGNIFGNSSVYGHYSNIYSISTFVGVKDSGEPVSIF